MVTTILVLGSVLMLHNSNFLIGLVGLVVFNQGAGAHFRALANSQKDANTYY